MNDDEQQAPEQIDVDEQEPQPDETSEAVTLDIQSGRHEMGDNTLLQPPTMLTLTSAVEPHRLEALREAVKLHSTADRRLAGRETTLTTARDFEKYLRGEEQEGA